ncbi:mastermind-like protein 3 isoform X3 [Brienomyrus brachyistius]|uniref:mastermind-like protein 3 isoform X3 n=1 Tax=Brienomyrus brachyistius TaxID=42636 RepID=UPI0020B336E8|nr:mastermind-like protein 3 isoform X3 [Brienomyrus brachyistius]
MRLHDRGYSLVCSVYRHKKTAKTVCVTVCNARYFEAAIQLQETVKRKLDSARSPLNGEHNGICDGSFSPNAKRVRKDGVAGGMDSLASLPNSVPPVPAVSPLHQLDIKPQLPLTKNTNSSNVHVPNRAEDLPKNGGLPDLKLQVNGSLDLDEGFSHLQNKEMKQEPLDDPAGIESSDTSLSNQNKLFSDINLNDQEWQELIDELVNTVPEDDMHDLFNEDFEEKKEPEFPRPAAQTPLPQEPPPVASSQNNQIPMGSPQVRPSSSGPQFGTAANSTPPQQTQLQQPPPVSIASSSPVNCVARSPQTPNQGQTQSSRPGNGFLINPGSGVLPGSASGSVGASGATGVGSTFPMPPTTAELSSAEQLKQMAAQQRAKLNQQKQQQQQQQQQQSSQAANWSPAGPPTSPYGGPFNSDKPNSPMMYPQAFNTQNPMVPVMGNNPQKAAMNSYLPQNHMNMISQQPNNMGQNVLSKQQGNVLSYSNTKPLSHFSAVNHMGQRMTPPVANPAKNSTMPYMQLPAGQGAGQPQVPAQAQGQIPGQAAHLSEERKRILLMNQKQQGLSYSNMPPHGQEQTLGVGIPRQPGGTQQSMPGPGGVAPGPGSNPGAPSYLGSAQQAAMMKQMQMEQEKRTQLHLLEQQKRQILREQRQQLLVEQMQQQQQQHLPRPMSQPQRHPYPVQQVNQFQGTPQEMAARNQALASIRNAQLMQQQQQQQQGQGQGMLQMPPVQMSGSMPVQPAGGAPSSDLNMAYNTQPGSQQGMYGLNPGMNQMLQHPNQSGMGVAHNPAPAQRQAGGGAPGTALGGGYGQGMLMNPAMSQQPLKGPSVTPPIAKAQAQRLQSMMGGGNPGAQNWQQQQQQKLQALGGRTSGEMVAFSSGTPYAMQPGQPRMPKQHFPQPVVDPRAMNPAMGGQMMPQMAGQVRTNQPRPMVMPGVAQAIPNMTTFSQGGGQPMAPSAGSYVQGGQQQSYQRTPGQDLSYGTYGGQPSGAGPFNLTDSADLDSTDGWMDEFFS